MRRILFATLTVAILSSCSGPAAQENASQEDDTGEERTSSEETLATSETTGPDASTTATDIDSTQNTLESPAVAGSGMVSSANPYATQAGTEILAEGGNAFDAAVAVAAALNVAEPMMSGVGGYGAIVVYDAESGETRFLDTGSRTPEALDPAVFRETTPNYIDNRCGAKAVTTPGNLNAWERLGGLRRPRMAAPLRPGYRTCRRGVRPRWRHRRLDRRVVARLPRERQEHLR